MKGKDHTGEKFGYLTVIGEAPKNKIPHRRVFVRCECGVEKSVDLPSLIKGSPRSCGCRAFDTLKSHWEIVRGLTRRLPTLIEARSIILYVPSTGLFFWKSRLEETFPSKRSYELWNARFAGKQAGSVDTKGYITISIFTKPIRAHRLAHFLIHGEWPEEQIDHINGNKLDNRWVNLRPASRKGNQRNQKRPKTNTSGIKGVIFDKSSEKWYFQMRRDDGSRYTKAGFPTKEEAAAECRKMRVKLHGEFANHG